MMKFVPVFIGSGKYMMLAFVGAPGLTVQS